MVLAWESQDRPEVVYHFDQLHFRGKMIVTFANCSLLISFGWLETEAAMAWP